MRGTERSVGECGRSADGNPRAMVRTQPAPQDRRGRVGVAPPRSPRRKRAWARLRPEACRTSRTGRSEERIRSSRILELRPRCSPRLTASCTAGSSTASNSGCVTTSRASATDRSQQPSPESLTMQASHSATKRAPCTARCHGAWPAPVHRPNATRCSAACVKNTPTIAARMAAPLPADMTPLGEKPNDDTNTRTYRRLADSPGQPEEPSKQAQSKRSLARAHITGMTGQALHEIKAVCSVSSDTKPVCPSKWNRSTLPKRLAIDRADIPSHGRPKSVSQRDAQQCSGEPVRAGAREPAGNQRVMRRSLQLPQELEELLMKDPRGTHVRCMAPPGMMTFLPCFTLVTSRSACASGIKRSCSPQMARTGDLICLSRSL